MPQYYFDCAKQQQGTSRIFSLPKKFSSLFVYDAYLFISRGREKTKGPFKKQMVKA